MREKCPECNKGCVYSNREVLCDICGSHVLKECKSCKVFIDFTYKTPKCTPKH